MANEAREYEVGYKVDENDSWEAEVIYDGVIGMGLGLMDDEDEMEIE